MKIHFKFWDHEKTREETFFEYFVTVTGAIAPILVWRQIFLLFEARDASTMSLAMWGLWLGIASVWLGYGIWKKLWPVIISQILWVASNAVMTAGIIMFS